ncbi:hypothetical protein GYMLUDRAFT_51815 [Collybiopsis luxurians FD-317 M1]|nr:hypothetical protein GYMLUDRAFT_51815 [Collybiopsis luxurians FD-317 M1]
MHWTTQSGASFSLYLCGEPIHIDIDIAELLQLHYVELEVVGDAYDSDGEIEPCETSPGSAGQPHPAAPMPLHESPALSSSSWLSPASLNPTSSIPLEISMSTFTSPTCSPASMSPTASVSPIIRIPQLSSLNPVNSLLAKPLPNYKDAQQRDSHAHRKCKRNAEHVANPETDQLVHQQHHASTLAQSLHIKYDAAKLPVNSSGFRGQCQQLAKDHCDAQTLCAQPSWWYIKHQPGAPSTAVVDVNNHLMVLVAGYPCKLEEWQSEVMLPLENAIKKGGKMISFAAKQTHHARGHFPALAVGVSHGGGQQRPGNCALSPCAHSFMDQLLKLPAMQCASGFMNCM